MNKDDVEWENKNTIIMAAIITMMVMMKIMIMIDYDEDDEGNKDDQ